MALTPSTMLPLGTAAPDFSLTDTVSGKTMTLASFAGKKGLLVVFLCNHCPYVKHLKEGLVLLGKDYEKKDVAIVAISANDPQTHPQDSPEQMTLQAKKSGFSFPYLFDQTQQTAKAYHAVCTPEFYLFDSERRLVYRGRFDASRPNSQVAVTGAELRAAADALLARRPVPADQRPSVGCSIKWRPGNAPT